eukprot:1329885-Alexandrium_andersonii.AAC.1
MACLKIAWVLWLHAVGGMAFSDSAPVEVGHRSLRAYSGHSAVDTLARHAARKQPQAIIDVT